MIRDDDPLLKAPRDRAERLQQVIDEQNKARVQPLTKAPSYPSGDATAPRFEPPGLGVPAAPGIDYAAVREANAKINASPWIKAEATRRGVDLGKVQATGAGRRISLENVRLAAAAMSAPKPSAPRVLVTRRSMFVHSLFVTVDEFGANPLADDLGQRDPQKFAAIVAAGDPPPTLFETGALPVFTTSGAQPGALAAVPWPIRHVAARANSAEAAQLLNQFTPGPTSDPAALAEEALMLFGRQEDNQDYQSRLATWWHRWEPSMTKPGTYEKRSSQW